MKTKLLLFVFLVSFITAKSQAPQSISYQAIARDNAGNILANQNISVRFTIQDLFFGGTTLYSETQNVLTNNFGSFTINIGQGIIVSGSFASIPWSIGNKFLKVEMDASGGSTFIDMGTQQLQSVPYALSSGDHRWTISGNDMYSTNSGNIGIGTSDPESKLDVNNLSVATPTVLSVESRAGTGLAEGGQLHLKGSYRGGDMITNDTIGQIRFRGYLSIPDSFYHAAGISAIVDGANSANMGGKLLFSTVNQGENILKTRMIIRNDGRVGIGTTLPLSTLDVRSPNNATIFNPGNLNIMTTDPQGADIGASITMGGNINTAATNPAIFASIDARKTNNSEGNVLGYLSFKTNNGGLGERMRITEIGNVGIGCAVPQYKLHVIGDITAQGGVLRATSATVSTAITACSDIRYKKSVIPLTHALDKIKMLNGVTYYWKKDEYPEKGFTDGKQIGVIAQELEKVFPELVLTDEMGYKTVDYSRLAPVLIEAVKEQQKLIDNLRMDVQKLNSVLQNEILDLKSRIDAVIVNNTNEESSTNR